MDYSTETPRHGRRRRLMREEDETGSESPGVQTRSPFGTTIRAVTPDPVIEEEEEPHAREGSSSVSPPTSPRSAVNRDNGITAASRAYMTRAGSNEDYASASRSFQNALSRPRTRTLEERTARDRSPASLFVTGRHRVGSVHSPSHGLHIATDETVTSIGHPSISPTSQSARSSTRGWMPREPPRELSPLPYSTATNQAESWEQTNPAPDPRKILQLMRSTCGRMSGMLAFRRGITSPWSLSFCYINEESGSLVYEPKSDSAPHRTLIPDLRGCKVRGAYDAEAGTSYIEVGLQGTTLDVHLRPPTEDDFNLWLAALLCWQPIPPKGILNRLAKPQATIAQDRRLGDSRRHSEVSLLKEPQIIKVGKMIYWDTKSSTPANTAPPTPRAAPGSRPSVHRVQSQPARRWRKVSCTLRENGELKLYADTDVTLVSVVQLSHLSRNAVQRLDPSVLDNEFCIAIYPQYTSASTTITLHRPIFLSLDSRVLYEVWIVLLRAFTVPQLYGPKQTATEELSSPISPAHTLDMFRMERSLSLKILEAKLTPPVSPKFGDMGSSSRPMHGTPQVGGYYLEVMLDGEVRARSAVVSEANHPFWGEEFEFIDLPAAMSTCTLVLKKRPAPVLEHGHSRKDTIKSSPVAVSSIEASGSSTMLSYDHTVGKVDIYLDDLDPKKHSDKWWPLTNSYGHGVGEVSVKSSTEESVILMARDYQPMSELLHRFSNSLTLQLAQMLPNELKRLSECLLNIFQVSGQAADWIMALVEEEVDGTLKETPVSRLRFSRRIGSSDSNESFTPTGDRELLVRDMGNNAKLEANLLFRGNTLLTKSLDFHMRRVGKEYLEETLSQVINAISDEDPDCEVDPNKVHSSNDLDKNWRRLIGWTERVWRAIFESAGRCPPELRHIFRHIRSCAEDRFGDFLRTVAYSSVSGFLFLRFFCPAVLNPNLFNLLKSKPRIRARRSYVLIAKSLQGLANMSTFGSKEHWMEPMNSFLNSHRQQFKTFLDNVCVLTSASNPGLPVPPSYSTPIQILSRLPPTSREGFPSLPYLIDHARAFATLVTLWLDKASDTDSIRETDGDLLNFHNICIALDQRTHDCLARAEKAERPTSTLSVKWEELVEQLGSSAILDLSRRQPKSKASRNGVVLEDDDSSPASTPITMGPRQSKPRQYSSSSTKPTSFPSTKTSISKYAPSFEYPSASASAAEETPPGSSHGWDEHESRSSRLKGIRGTIGRSHVDPSLDGSDEEYPTALPQFAAEKPREHHKEKEKDKEKSGFKGIFPRKKKDK